ncbi:restriction endonuclease subunit S [Pseudorhodoplanes sp.]|uniref:restriction endonuclease subunit S n=1 Tax=Pseudorhodoplanes sp. TaxID=1934341 RepID=UPI00391C8397
MLERPISKAGWTRVRFDQIATQINDRVDNPAEAGVERYVGLEHLDPDSLRIRRWGEPTDVESTKLRFQPGDIIFGKRRVYQRKVAVADFEGICSAHAMVLRAKPGAVLPEFLPFFMQSDLFMERALSISVGSLSPTINWKTLAAEEFLLPPIQEQARLLEPLIGVCTLAEGLATALDIGEKTYEAWIESELKDHDWPHRPAIDLLTRATVGIVVKPADWYVSSGQGVPALRSLNVLKNRLSWGEHVEISHEGHQFHRKSALSAGDVVIVRSGRPGDAAVIPPLDHPLNAIDLIISTTGPDLRPEFFCRFLNSVAGRRQFASGIAGTAQLHFNVELFKKLRIPVPPLTEQDVFIARAHQFDGSLNDLRERLAAAQDLKKAILKECVAYELH